MSSSSHQQHWSYESSYPIASHHDSLSRGVHPSGLNRVNPKPHQQLRRHTSDRSHHHSRGKLNHDTASNQIASLSSGYVSADLRTSDYPHLRRSRGSASDYTAYKERDVTHSTTSSDINTSGYHQLRPSSSSLDRHSFSDGSQSSFTGSSAEATNRVPPSHVGGVDRGYRGSPASSQSDFSDHRHLHQRYGNSQGPGGGSSGGLYHSLPRSRSSLAASGSATGLDLSTEERNLKTYNHPSGVLHGSGRVWPVEEEDNLLHQRSQHHPPPPPPRTINTTDDYWLPRQIPPVYFSRSSTTSPSFSSDGGSNDIPWYEEDNPNIHSGLFFPRQSPNPPPPHHPHHPRPHSYHHTIEHTGIPLDRPHLPTTPTRDPVGRDYDVMAEQKMLAQQRLARYFRHGGGGGDNSRILRRESSPADIGRGDETLPLREQEPKLESVAEKSPPTHGKKSPSKHKRVGRSKSSAIGKLVKKLSSKGKTDKTTKSEETNGTPRGRKTLSNSNSNLEDFMQRVKRSQSMEFLQLGTPVLSNGRKVVTPTPSPGTTPKPGKSLFRARRNSESDLENFGTLVRTGSKKNLTVDTTQALFEAIEAEDEGRCQSLLDSQDGIPPDLNSPNDDNWTPLDVAVMLNERIALLLLSYGAKDSARYFKDPEYRREHLKELLKRAEVERKTVVDTIEKSGGGTKELDKQLVHLTTRVNLMRKMKANVDRTGPPGAPRDVQLIVSSAHSLTVRFSEPEFSNGASVTRYKVQWSKGEQFKREAGEFIICDIRSKEYVIPGLDNGEKYYVRVSAFNLKGYGQPKTSIPTFAVPSSWHDCDRSEPRYYGRTTQIEAISANMNQILAQQDTNAYPGTPSTNRRSIKKGLTKFFSQGIKFHKSLKTGVYLSCIIYSDEGRVLVTMDDNLPLVEVSDSLPSSISGDFAWLAKVACNWEDVQEMSDESDSHTSSPAIQFRNKLLHALLMLQEGTGLQDLGLLHHCTYQDSHGSLIFTLVQYIEDYKGVQGVNTRWSSMAKLRRKFAQFETGGGGGADHVGDSSADQLLRDVPNIIHHHTRCSHVLQRGLYLGYLKARVSSSVASMTIVTSGALPNVLPHYRIRENPNISQSEWEWLRSMHKKTEAPPTNNYDNPSPYSLQKNLCTAVEHFLDMLGVDPEETNNTQLYIEEAIELNEDVTFLLLMPPPENVCTPPGSSDQFGGSHFSDTPIATFELLQLYTYQRPFMLRFAQVSARLDIELLITQKKRREAFSKAEGAAAKSQHEQLQKIHEDTEQTWRQMRWIETVLKNGRETQVENRLLVKQLRENFSRMTRSGTSSSLSSSASSSTAGRPFSPIKKSVASVLSSHNQYIRVYPAYETGLSKGTSVKIFITSSTVTDEVILVTVEQLEKARKEKGIPGHDIRGRDIADFYLVAVLPGHREEVLAPRFTPLQLLSCSSKYKFILRRSMDQQTTDV